MKAESSDSAEISEITFAEYLIELLQTGQQLEKSVRIDIEESTQLTNIFKAPEYGAIMDSMTVSSGADECEHLRKIPEPEEYEIIIGCRKLVQSIEYACALDYTIVDCPLVARCCKAKIEDDHNAADLAGISLIELGTRDINVIYNDRDNERCNEESE